MKLRRVLRLVLLQVTSSLWLLIIVDVLSHLPNLRSKYEIKWSEVIASHSTCMMLSSDTEQITQGSLGFHEKSEIYHRILSQNKMMATIL